MSPPKISVIIPVFNGERFIAEAIQSVLDQKYEPLEIIVIDDGSTDESAKIVKSLPGYIRYFYQPNAGIAAARNKGIEMANGELIGLIDQDDVWLSNKLQLQTAILNQHPEAGIAIGLLVPLGFESRNEVTDEQIFSGKSALALHMGSALIRKSVFEKIGVFDTSLKLGEDSDWFFRVMEADIKVHVMQDIVQLYRRHNTNITIDKTRANSYMLKAFKKSIDRRRKAGVLMEVPLTAFNNIGQVKEIWLKK